MSTFDNVLFEGLEQPFEGSAVSLSKSEDQSHIFMIHIFKSKVNNLVRLSRAKGKTIVAIPVQFLSVCLACVGSSDHITCSHSITALNIFSRKGTY
jgi:hypothetical protein